MKKILQNIVKLKNYQQYKISGAGYTFYRPWNQKTAPFNFLNIFRHLIIIYVFQVYKNTQ